MDFRRFMAAVLMLILVLSLSACTQAPPADDGANGGVEDSATGSVMLYAALKEAQLTALKEAFSAKYPDISFDYYTAGAGSIMTKIATEDRAGQIGCDIIWLGQPNNLMVLKDQGLLMPYESPNSQYIAEAYRDPDNTYIGARMVVMGISYNTALIDEDKIPTRWEDLLDDYFCDQIMLTDPMESGTMAYLLGAMVNNPKYGWEFFEELKDKQGAVLNSSATGCHNDIAAGGYLATIGVDYVTQTLADSGATIDFVYPEEDVIVISGPMAIMKDTQNEECAKIFYDWVLSKEAQQILADTGATPIRDDVTREGAIPVSEINTMTGIDDRKLADELDKYFDRFDSIFKE